MGSAATEHQALGSKDVSYQRRDVRKDQREPVKMLNCCLEAKKGMLTFSEKEIQWPEKDFEGDRPCPRCKAFACELRSHHALLLERETEAGWAWVGWELF